MSRVAATSAIGDHVPGHVLILKETEDRTTAVYRFGPDEERIGRLRLDKQTGESDELEPVPGDGAEISYIRAAVKLKKHWQTGELPDKTVHASW